MKNRYIDVEYDEVEELITYYLDTEDSELQTIEASKIEIAKTLYEVKYKKEYNDNYVIYPNGAEVILSEWAPDNLELTKYIKYYEKINNSI